MRVTFDQLPQFAKFVLVDGAFDPVHAGHIAYLNAARAKGPLLCAVAPDDAIREKGREPLLPQDSRVAVMEAICDVVYAKDRPLADILNKMQPVAFIKGSDWIGLEGAECVDTVRDSSTARLRAWASAEDRRHLAGLEHLVLHQEPPQKWTPVTNYSFEARKAIEGQHPELIRDVFRPKRVLDAGCGPGHLVRLLEDVGVDAYGMDLHPPESGPYVRRDIAAPFWGDPSAGAFCDLVICREVLEHIPVRHIAQAVANLCQLSSQFVYVTTRFATPPAHLLHVDTADELDPTHITMLNQDLLRALFVLNGLHRRPDLEERMDWQRKGRVLVYEH
jgi:cytidyltransferase-like protein